MDQKCRNKQERKKSLAASVACMAIYWPTPGFKGRTSTLCLLTRWDLNFCVPSSTLRGCPEVWWTNNFGHESTKLPLPQQRVDLAVSVSGATCTATLWTRIHEKMTLAIFTKGVTWLVFWAQSTTQDYIRAKTNFNLSPIYSSHKSSNHKSLKNIKSVLTQIFI